ncbi:MAG: NUDIX domain-containing protein [Bradymonadaceae bacterium]
MTRQTEKALVYVTRRGKLLVFDHPNHPAAGTQVPGGTIEDAETPIEAARRELREESGLEEFDVVDKLGTATFDMSKWRDERQHRHFFWIRCGEPTPPSWRGWERDHGDPIALDFRWVPFEALPELHAGQGALLTQLRDRSDRCP